MTGREWKPDDLADINGSRAMRNKRNDGWIWSDGRNSPDSFTAPGARPLVVIDPEDHEQVERLDHALQKVSGEATFSATSRFLQDALREFANPTPPKPEEPTGLGAVVEDVDGHLWTRGRALANHWTRDDGHFNNHAGSWFKYAEIDAVRVLSEGVQS